MAWVEFKSWRKKPSTGYERKPRRDIKTKEPLEVFYTKNEFDLIKGFTLPNTISFDSEYNVMLDQELLKTIYDKHDSNFFN